MRPDRPKSVRDYALLWLAQMRRYLEDAEQTGDTRKAYVACAQLTGGLALAASLRLIRPKDVEHWEEYMKAKSASLECSVFGPNPEEGHTS